MEQRKYYNKLIQELVTDREKELLEKQRNILCSTPDIEEVKTLSNEFMTNAMLFKKQIGVDEKCSAT